MAMNNSERLRKGFALLIEGLRDPVADVMTKFYGTKDWTKAMALEAQRKHGGNLQPVSEDDVQTYLRAINEHKSAFKGILSYTQQAYASELTDIRNKWAHDIVKTPSSEETLRALSTIELLLNAVDAPDSAADVRKMRDDLQRTVYEDHTRKISQSKILRVSPTQGMKPWREVITPHEDVATGRFTASEFAANLYDVAVSHEACTTGNAYGDPVEFFNRTYLTEGLRDLLTRAIKRIAGDGSGSPVVNLQTNFGGGKTHSLLALYHLFGDEPIDKLSADIQNLVSGLGADAWQPGTVRRAAIVGNYLNTTQVSVKPDGTQVHTIWGELAWQLGGAEGYAMVAENDLAGTPPADAIGKLLRRYSPCLILIDEWARYASQLVGKSDLPAGSFDDQFTFAQTLTEAVGSTPHCMLAVSIPASEENGKASNSEVGGENGQIALRSLQKVVGRKADQWRPSTRDESFEIVRKRLFEEPDAQAQDQIALTARRFVEMYRADPKAYPTEVTGSDYEKRIRASYPLHPELLDRLYEDWSSLEKFQRTRGVLTLVSTIIHELWAGNDTNPLILPGVVPLESEAIYSNLVQYLPDSWKAIIDTDAAGPLSTAAQIDNDRPVLGQRQLTQRIASTVLMGSAPRVGLPNQGIGKQHVWLGTAMPGDKVGNFDTALSQLEQQSTYFFVDGSTYRYSLQPSIGKTARDYAERLREDPETVYNEIVKRLQPEGNRGNRGLFRRVCVAPAGNDGIPDTDQATLVILHPRFAVAKGEGESSDTKRWIRDAIEHRGSAQRANRNMLVFLAADATQLGFAEDTARSYLGWKQVADQEVQLNLTRQQIEQAKDSIATLGKTLDERIRNAYYWCVYPEQLDPKEAYHLTDTRIPDSGGDSMAERTGSKLDAEDVLSKVYAPNSLGADIHRYLRSAFVDGMLPAKTVWECITKFPYMPRLLDRDVFNHAIEDTPNAAFLEEDRFAIASGRYTQAKHFQGLIIPGVTDTSQVTVHVTDSTLIVDWDVAMEDHKAFEAEKEASRRAAEAERNAKSPVSEALADIVKTYESATGDSVAALSDGRPFGDLDGVGDIDAGGADKLRVPTAAPAPASAAAAAPAPKTRYFGNVSFDSVLCSRELSCINDDILEQLRLAGADVSISINVEIRAILSDGFDKSTIQLIDGTAKKLKFDSSEFEEEE